METGEDRRERAEAILEALDVAERRERVEEAGAVERRTRRLQGAVAADGDPGEWRAEEPGSGS